ncbi:hypothetical protein NDA18_000300 [Ustilago nuda]|nr:hypothetical protein NDA18_000300 [Ustilago nuda]
MRPFPTGAPTAVLPGVFPQSAAASLATPAFARLLGCSTPAASLLLHSLSEHSRCQYDSVSEEYQTFCLQHFSPNQPALPSSNLHLIKWIAALGCAGHSYHAIRHRLTALSSWHVDLGLDSSAFTHPRRPALSSHDRITFTAAFTLSYACLLWCAEFTWSNLNDSILRVGSNTWSETYATLRLARSKTDPFGASIDLIIPKVGGPICPYTALCTVCGPRPLQAPLFALDNGVTPFSCDRVIGVLRQLLGQLGLPAAAYAGHSFHRGVSTWVALLGAPTKAIQALGHWSSNCFHWYIDCPPSAHSKITASYLFSASPPT